MRAGKSEANHREEGITLTRRSYRHHEGLCTKQGRKTTHALHPCEGAQAIACWQGDIVRMKGRWIKQVNAIYGDGRLAFKRVKGEPPSARPKDCQLLERGRTVVWEKVL